MTTLSSQIRAIVLKLKDKPFICMDDVRAHMDISPYKYKSVRSTLSAIKREVGLSKDRRDATYEFIINCAAELANDKGEVILDDVADKLNMKLTTLKKNVKKYKKQNKWPFTSVLRGRIYELSDLRKRVEKLIIENPNLVAGDICELLNLDYNKYSSRIANMISKTKKKYNLPKRRLYGMLDVY